MSIAQLRISIARILIACSIIFAVQFTAEKEAKAYLMGLQVASAASWVAGYGMYDPVDIIFKAGGCMFATGVYFFPALPLCLLNETGSYNAIDQAFIVENGYTSEQANLILNDIKALVRDANSKKLRMEITANETRESLAEGLRLVSPQTSDLTIDFVADLKGI